MRFFDQVMRRHRVIIFGVFVAAALVLSGSLLLYTTPNNLDRFNDKPWDGLVDWTAARYFLEHRNPYSPESLREIKLDGLGHPPTTSFWMLPFAQFPLSRLSALWGHFMILLLFMQYLIIAHKWRAPAFMISALLLFSLTMATPFMTNNLHLVQLSGLVSFWFVLAWYFLKSENDIGAGICLGLVCTIKLFPGLLVLLLLLARKVRAVVAASIAYLIVFTIMTARFGWIAWPQFFASERIITDYWIGSNRNASLYGIVLRLMGLPRTRPDVSAIVLALSVALLCGAIAISWRLIRRRELEIPYALFLVLAVFLNPFLFEHYFLLFTLPVLIAGYSLWKGLCDHLFGKMVFVAGFGILALILLCMAQPIAQQAALRGNPAMHMLMRVYEVAEAAPAILLMILLAGLAWLRGRQLSPGAAALVA